MNKTLRISWRTTKIFPTKCIDRAPQAITVSFIRIVWRETTSVSRAVRFERLLAFLDAIENTPGLEQQVAQPFHVCQRVLLLRHEIFVLTGQARHPVAEMFPVVLLRTDLLGFGFKLLGDLVSFVDQLQE